MVTVLEFTPDALPVFNVAEAARYARVSGDPVSMERLPRLKTRLDSVLAPRACYEVYDVTVDGDKVTIGTLAVNSRGLAICLGGCSRAAVFAATVGRGVDRMIRAEMLTCPGDGCLLGATGSERVEALCDLVCSTLKDREANGKSIRPRFSPGYGDLPLEIQSDIFALLGCTRNIGISLGSGLIMTPEKSVTAIVGIEDRKGEEL